MSVLGRWLVVSMAAASLVGVTPITLSAQTSLYLCTLLGASEVPATSSTATGSFSATLDEGAKTLTWSLDLPSITNATLAHIHLGAAGVSGPPVVTLFTSVPAGSVSISGTSGPGDVGGPFTGNWDGFVAALKSGDVYVNVHTSANPGGEIRGQIRPAGAVDRTATAAATSSEGAATATPTATPRTVTATPAAPKTGQAGFGDISEDAGLAFLLAVIGVALVGGSRLLSSRHR